VKAASLLLMATALPIAGMAGSARAASFDCATAATPFEKTVCGSAELSSLDDKLAAAFASALAPLSHDGRAAFRQSERAWLRFVARVCRLDGKKAPRPKEAPPPAQCLQSEYQLRLRQLATAVTVADGLVIHEVDLYAAHPDETARGTNAGFDIVRIAYPQIDRPKSGSERAWNQQMAEEAKKRIPADSGEPSESSYLQTGYVITLVTPEVISLVFDDYVYSGGAHGNSIATPFVWLRRQARFIAAGDVFSDAKDWRKAMARACLKALETEARKEDKNFDPYEGLQASDLEAAVADPARWTIEASGLGTQFQKYEIGPGVLGTPKCVVPWSVVKPYMSPKAAFTIPSG